MSQLTVPISAIRDNLHSFTVFSARNLSQVREPQDLWVEEKVPRPSTGVYVASTAAVSAAAGAAAFSVAARILPPQIALGVGLAAAGIGAVAAGKHFFGKAQAALEKRDKTLEARAALLSNLTETKGLAGGQTYDYPLARVLIKDDKILLDFKRSGEILLAEGIGSKADLISLPEFETYGEMGRKLGEYNDKIKPTTLKRYTADGKEIPERNSWEKARERKVFFDPEAGRLTVSGITYDLKKGTVEGKWLLIEQGKIKKAEIDGPHVPVEYVGNGGFRTVPEGSGWYYDDLSGTTRSSVSYRYLDIEPEILGLDVKK